MKLTHDEIRSLLPDYLHGATAGDMKQEIERHLEECGECKNALVLLSRLSRLEAPDPGESFWRALPGKVAAAVKEEKKAVFSFKRFFFRPVFAGGIAAAVLLVISYAVLMKKNAPSEYDPLLFNPPLSASSIDYSDISEKEMSMITKKLPIKELQNYSETFADGSYHGELAGLNAEELDRVSERLLIKQQRGG